VRPGRCKTCLGSPSCGESVWLRPTDDDVFAISFVSSRVGRLVPRADLLGTSSTVFNFSYERSGIPPWPRPSRLCERSKSWCRRTVRSSLFAQLDGRPRLHCPGYDLDAAPPRARLGAPPGHRRHTTR
jgi:hypothetical protein